MPSGRPVRPHIGSSRLFFASAMLSVSRKAAWRPDLPSMKPNCSGCSLDGEAACWCFCSIMSITFIRIGVMVMHL